MLIEINNKIYFEDTSQQRVILIKAINNNNFNNAIIMITIKINN